MKRQYTKIDTNLKEIAHELGVSYQTVYYRHKKGLPLRKPLVKPYKAFQRELGIREWSGEIAKKLGFERIDEWLDSKALYDRVRYNQAHHGMTEQRALEFVLEDHDITE